MTRDQAIDQVTERVARNVPGAADYGIMTACFIDGEFVCVTHYDITSEMYEQLKAAAKEQERRIRKERLHAASKRWAAKNQKERQ